MEAVLVYSDRTERTQALIAYSNGDRESVQLIAVPSGWRIACVPLQSEAIAFGDLVDVVEDDGVLHVVRIVNDGGWATIRSRTPVMDHLHEGYIHVARAGWLMRSDGPGYVSICAPDEDVDEARRILDSWEAAALIARIESTL